MSNRHVPASYSFYPRQGSGRVYGILYRERSTVTPQLSASLYVDTMNDLNSRSSIPLKTHAEALQGDISGAMMNDLCQVDAEQKKQVKATLEDNGWMPAFTIQMI
ncbi:hypothetical protein KDA_24010 [Dictyobacter alpinus]|uniref:Uncharacterized protein n=1 Tax=Dictyobacter alpinus TaxID=2014873 RepID=A0A402B6H2_9CHLR|nr:hypothetical protein KDA_24010 [Dictyobacter alpinus]